jgi:hypothetical protein
MAKYLAIAAALVMFIPGGAFAKDKSDHEAKTEHKVKIDEAVQVGSTQLQPGTYEVAWQNTGKFVPITFTHNGKTVLTTRGHIVEQSKPSDTDEVLMRKTNTNQQRLEELIFGHHKEALSFTTPSGM